MLDSESYTRTSALTSTLMFRHRRKKQASVHINAVYISDKRAFCAIHRVSQCKVRDIARSMRGLFGPNHARTSCEIYVCKAGGRAYPLMGLCKCCRCHLTAHVNVSGSLRRLAVTLDLVRAPCLGKPHLKYDQGIVPHQNRASAYLLKPRCESLPRGLASSEAPPIHQSRSGSSTPHNRHTAVRDLYQVCIPCNNDDAPEF